VSCGPGRPIGRSDRRDRTIRAVIVRLEPVLDDFRNVSAGFLRPCR
jgi:hypothetical protein